MSIPLALIGFWVHTMGSAGAQTGLPYARQNKHIATQNVPRVGAQQQELPPSRR